MAMMLEVSLVGVSLRVLQLITNSTEITVVWVVHIYLFVQSWVLFIFKIITRT